jgi:MarR family transcriptional regulator for hemolysin
MKDSPYQAFGFLLHDTARRLRWNFERRALQVGLTRAQWSVLFQLKRQDGLKQQELAQLLDVTAITVGRLIDRLEAAGWIIRCDDPEDRRAKRIFLTEKVTPVLEQMAELSFDTREEALAGLDDAARRRLMESLQHIRDNLALAEEKRRRR